LVIRSSIPLSHIRIRYQPSDKVALSTEEY